MTAERERLDARLAHERQLVDVADLRAVLERGLDASDRLSDAIRTIERGGDSVPEDLFSGAHGALVTLHKCANELQIRLPDGHPLLVAYTALAAAFEEATSAAGEQDHERFVASRKLHAAAYRQLVRAAKDSLASQLPAS